jgi:hypothetical protein
MAILSKMYFNAVFGALGGLVGWMLFGILGEKNPSEERQILSDLTLNLLLGGAIIGSAIGFFVVSVEAIRDQSLVRFARLASYGVLIACIPGAIGMYIGDRINEFLVNHVSSLLIVTMFARGLGWSLLGIAIGGTEGIAARALGKFSYGTIGGLMGGFIGGVLYEMFDSVARLTQSNATFWSALGLAILGACIGSLSALVQAAFQPASVKVMRGWQEGREYPLDKPINLLGRDEYADIALFRDMKVEKRHCLIKYAGGKYLLVNQGAPPQLTLVNDVPIAEQCELKDGDRIQLGNVILKFQWRAAVLRSKAKKPPLATVPR